MHHFIELVLAWSREIVTGLKCGERRCFKTLQITWLRRGGTIKEGTEDRRPLY